MERRRTIRFQREGVFQIGYEQGKVPGRRPNQSEAAIAAFATFADDDFSCSE